MIMSFFRSLFGCVNQRGINGNGRTFKVRFGVPLNEVFKGDTLPIPLRDLLVYIAREGVSVTDLFRRPGNPTDQKKIIKRMAEGREVVWTEFNFWTVANVAKKFLLAVPDGVFGREGEAALLRAMDNPDQVARLEEMHQVIRALRTPAQHLVALLFGIWFRMIYHTDWNAMSVEAVAKSVAGSIFHSCTDDPRKVERASKAMEVLITGFPSAELFGEDLVEYFTSTTKTSINRHEVYAYECRYPRDVLREEAMRLFVSMLLEESRKHRFDLIRNAANEQQYLAAVAAAPNIVQGIVPDPSQPVSYTAVYSRTPVLSGLRKGHDASAAAGDTTSVYSVVSDSLLHHAAPVESPTIEELDDVQSYPNYRKPDSFYRRRTEPYPSCTTYSTLPHRSSKHAGTNNHCWDDDTTPASHEQEQDTSALVSHQRTPSSRYNSVRRRQLERLARRTNWFLSSREAADSSLNEQLAASSGPDLLETTGGDCNDTDSLLGLGPCHVGAHGQVQLSRRCFSHTSDRDEDNTVSEVRYFVVDRVYGPS